MRNLQIPKQTLFGTKRADIRKLKNKLKKVSLIGEEYLEYMQQYQLMVQRLKQVQANDHGLIDLSINSLIRFGTYFKAHTHQLKNTLNSDVTQIIMPICNSTFDSM